MWLRHLHSSINPETHFLVTPDLLPWTLHFLALVHSIINHRQMFLSHNLDRFLTLAELNLQKYKQQTQTFILQYMIYNGLNPTTRIPFLTSNDLQKLKRKTSICKNSCDISQVSRDLNINWIFQDLQQWKMLNTYSLTQTILWKYPILRVLVFGLSH